MMNLVQGKCICMWSSWITCVIILNRLKEVEKLVCEENFHYCGVFWKLTKFSLSQGKNETAAILGIQIWLFSDIQMCTSKQNFFSSVYRDGDHTVDDSSHLHYLLGSPLWAEDSHRLHNHLFIIRRIHSHGLQGSGRGH